MSDLEVKQQLQLNTQQPTENGSQQVQKKNPEGKPTIFVGMTEAQAKEQGLLDQFNRANTDRDGTISDKEYASYVNNQNNTVPSSKSGKRTAQGGIYTVQKGDSLSLIAQDFGLDTFDLYAWNKNTIGKNMNKIEVGQQLKITPSSSDLRPISQEKTPSKKQIQLNKQKHKQELYKKLSQIKFSQKTLTALSKQYGKDLTQLSTIDLMKDAQNYTLGDISKSFNIVMKTATKDELKAMKGVLSNGDITSSLLSNIVASFETEEESKEFFSKFSNIVGQDVTKIKIADLETSISKLTKEQQKEIQKAFVSQLSDPEISTLKGLDKNTDAKTLIKYYGLKKEGQNTVEDIAKGINIKLKQDLDLKNENSEVNLELAKLKKGQFTKKELKSLGDTSNLSNEALIQLAKQRIITKHITAISNAQIESLNSEQYHEIIDLLNGYDTSDLNQIAEDNGVKTQILGATAAMVLESEAPDEIKTEYANIVASDSEKFGTQDLDDEIFESVTTQLAQYAEEDSLKQYTIDNSERVDIIKNVYEEVASNSTDENRKNILSNIIKTTDEIISQQGGSRTSGKNETKEAPVPEQRVISQATYNTPEAERIAKIREASNSYTSSNTTNPIQSSHNDNKYLVTNDESEKLANIQKSLKRKFNDLKSKSIGQALSDVVENFDNIPRDIQVKIKNYFKAMKPDRQCEAYIGGSETLRKFMDKETGMSATLLNGYFTKHPLELNKAPKEIQTKMEDYNKKIHKPYDKNMDLNFNNFGFSAI